MNAQTRVCQNCKNQFTIEPDDFQFYEKIEVPPPTFCPECRMQRRLASFNLFNLYNRKCDLCKNEKISMYSPDAPYKVYCPQCWWSDNWDPFDYEKDYDFAKPFFEQFDELWHEVPLLSLSIDTPTSLHAPYNNHSGHLKNCYLIFYGDEIEDASYGYYLFKSKNILDCSLAKLIEFCYDNRNSFKNNRCIGVRNTVESVDCVFLRTSSNCQNCFASANLRNKKYYIFNKPYAKEEYFKEIKKWDLGSYKTYQEVFARAREHWRQYPPKPIYQDFSTNVTGNYVFESRNCRECYEVMNAEDSKYLSLISALTRDCYDISGWGNNMELSYECCIVGENVSRIKFSQESGLTLHDVEYSKLSTGGKHHFGSISVKKGDYCILNKRYTKEKYEVLREKIIQHMNDVPYSDKRGNVYRYGEFFPIEISPFAYNETFAQTFFPLSREDTGANGYKYREPKQRKHRTTKRADELPDHIKDAPADLLQEVIQCSTCERGFKIIPSELEFLKKMNLPLPRRCPFCRIQEKFAEWVKQMQLGERTCSKCKTTFQTPYTEEEYQKMWCMKCYNEEVI